MPERVPYIIAEIGINHNGSMEDAKKLIRMAKDCDCDAVKFQKRDINTVYTKEFLDSPRESPWGTTQRAQKEGLEFNEKQYDEINEFCAFEIPWFASSWDIKSQKLMRKYDFPHNKIASAMLTHREFVKTVAEEGKHTFISTGGSTMENIRDAIAIFDGFGTPFTLTHTNSTYPCADNDCNIRAILMLRIAFNRPVGYSGHEVGILPSVLAVATGAVAIERHITLDRAGYGSDQAASLEKHGLELLVRDCRSVTGMMGNGEKNISEKERGVMRKLRYFEDDKNI